MGWGRIIGEGGGNLSKERFPDEEKNVLERIYLKFKDFG